MNAAPTLGVVTTDRDFVIRGWNDWVAEATGQSEAAVAGMPLLDFVAAERTAFYRELFSEVLATGSARVLAPAFHHYLIQCPPRSASAHFDYMQQRVTVAPLTAGTDAVGLIITLEDVTGRLDRERTLAAELERQAPDDRLRATDAALASSDWTARGAAVRTLQQSASVEELRHLLATLQRDHHDLNVLNSALRVVIGAGRAVIEPLVQLLSDEAPNLRMHAALALGELRAREATPLLVNALDDPDDNVRFHAIEALGRIGDAESVAPLARIAASDNFFLAFAAIDALGKADDARVAPLMVRLLDQELLRPAAIATLAAIGDEDCVPALGRALTDTLDDAGPIAAALVRIHDRYEQDLSAGSFIIDCARDAISAAGRERLAAAVAREHADRPAVAAVLGWLGAPALEPLLALVGDTAVEEAIDRGLVTIGAEAVEPLIARLQSAAPAVRVAAASLLGRLGDRRAIPALIRALDTADAELCTTAAAALGSIGDPAASDALVGLFAHPGAGVRRAAIAALNTIGGAGTADRIRASLSDPDPHVRECALRVAGYFGFADCVADIVRALEDPVEDVRRAAIEQLPVLEDIDAPAHLTAALTAETPRNRAAAAHAMRLVTDAGLGAALTKALSDTDAWVRYFAAVSLATGQFSSTAADSLAGLARHDPATHVRIAAIGALGATAPEMAAAVAAELVNDADDDLAIAAIKVLGTVRRPMATDCLARAVRSSRPALQMAAVRAFATRPNLAGVEMLAWAARAPESPAVSDEAIGALGTIAANGEQPGVQRAAVNALRELAAEGARRDAVIGALARLPEDLVPEVASGLSDGRIGIRVATADALAAMRHPRASNELARALRDEHPAVRAAAVAAFARLGTTGVARTIATMRLADPDEGVRHRADLACTRHGWGPMPVARA